METIKKLEKEISGIQKENLIEICQELYGYILPKNIKFKYQIMEYFFTYFDNKRDALEYIAKNLEFKDEKF